MQQQITLRPGSFREGDLVSLTIHGEVVWTGHGKFDNTPRVGVLFVLPDGKKARIFLPEAALTPLDTPAVADVPESSPVPRELPGPAALLQEVPPAAPARLRRVPRRGRVPGRTPTYHLTAAPEPRADTTADMAADLREAFGTA